MIEFLWQLNEREFSETKFPESELSLASISFHWLLFPVRIFRQFSAAEYSVTGFSATECSATKFCIIEFSERICSLTELWNFPKYFWNYFLAEFLKWIFQDTIFFFFLKTKFWKYSRQNFHWQNFQRQIFYDRFLRVIFSRQYFLRILWLNYSDIIFWKRISFHRLFWDRNIQEKILWKLSATEIPIDNIFTVFYIQKWFETMFRNFLCHNFWYRILLDLHYFIRYILPHDN